MSTFNGGAQCRPGRSATRRLQPIRAPNEPHGSDSDGGLGHEPAPHQRRARIGVPRGICSSAAALALTVGLLAGCGAGSSSPTTATGVGTGATSEIPGPAGASPATAADSPSEHTRYCNAIKLPDAQVLLKDTITQVQFDPIPGGPHEPFDCTLMTTAEGGDNLVVTVTTADNFSGSVADENAGTGTALTGIGDKAVWVQDLTKANPPIVVAIKGSVTCRVTAPTTEKTTIAFTNPNGVDQITAAAAETFAQKMAVLCTDVFAAPS